MPPWLDRYQRPFPIRARGPFHLISAARVADGRPVVVVVPGPGANRALVAEAFSEVERVHQLVEHPRLPRVSARGVIEDTPYLELDCDAVVDGVDMVRLFADGETKIPYAAADGFIVSLRDVLEAAHAVTCPRTGGPICLGRLSTANVLFAPSGQWYLVGLGRNFPLEKEGGGVDGWVTSFQAPEISAGAEPSPMGDYLALLLFMRSLASYVEMSDTIARMLRGDVRAGDLELLERIRWFDQHVIVAPPTLRPSLQEAIAVSDRVRELLGEAPDPARFAAFVATHLERWEEPVSFDESEPSGPLALALGPDGAWLAGPDGDRHRLGRALRRIVMALVKRHLEAPGAALTMWELLEVGWPGEEPIPAAGANRVYAALARLRRMGLRDALERFEDGYRLAPRTVVRMVD
ncbi:transcriptional regulator, LuxR family, putative [Minicystis rosea]|nr:transcriptional regulator, LuxR family, putative [Minicystis rosea]